MNQEPWYSFLDAMRADRKSPFYASKQDLERFAEFARQLPEPERIPLLVHAYDRYRSLAACNEPFEIEVSCYSLLISALLDCGIRPDREQAYEILRKSFHRCGHGSDVEPPLTLAEQAFRSHPYSNDLFDSVAAYRETLRVDSARYEPSAPLIGFTEIASFQGASGHNHTTVGKADVARLVLSNLLGVESQLR